VNLLQTFETGFRGIIGHRLRSFLTTLGILFGVGAVICTVAIGQASSDAVNSRIASLGTNLLTVTPGSTRANGVSGGGGSANTLTMTDVEGLQNKQNVPDVSAVAPVVQARTTLVNTTDNWQTTVSGSTPDWLITSARTVAEGQFFTAADVTNHAQKIVLGVTAAQNLNAKVGDMVTAGPGAFQVIGILNTVGGQGFQNQDDLGVMPITSARDGLTGANPNAVQRILLSATDGENVGTAYDETNRLLMNTHNTAAAAAPDFRIQAQSSFLSTATAVTDTLTILLASVAAISLLVGGIGVMNIMLVSVTERTSEIGLRKALGATPGDLLRQFLVEATTLSIVGGALGVGAALIAGALIPRVTTIGMTITATPILVSVGVAAAVGLLFGVYPAARAARLAPIEALRSQ
jgi:putative ABC transport system permease protein